MRTAAVVLISLVFYATATLFVFRLQMAGVESDLTLAVAGLGLSIALVAATIMLVDEGRRTRESHTAPMVTVTVRPWSETNLIHELRIQNHGRGPAHDIEFALDGDLVVRGGGKLSGLRVFCEGMRFLEPGGAYVSVVGGPEFMKANVSSDSDAAVALRIVSTCRGYNRRRHTSVSWIELRKSHWPTPAIRSIADSTKAIQQALEKFGLRRPT